MAQKAKHLFADFVFFFWRWLDHIYIYIYMSAALTAVRHMSTTKQRFSLSQTHVLWRRANCVCVCFTVEACSHQCPVRWWIGVCSLGIFPVDSSWPSGRSRAPLMHTGQIKNNCNIKILVCLFSEATFGLRTKCCVGWLHGGCPFFYFYLRNLWGEKTILFTEHYKHNFYFT